MDKEKQTKIRNDVTGNCWNNRHHTCKGHGRTKNEGTKQVEAYKCKCECHKEVK